MNATLYARAEAALRARIASGEWRPGAALPTEPALAAELRVSQGTLRRALAALEAGRVIERRQGVGTFVAEATSERALFHFFRAERLDGTRPVPTSRVLAQARRRATAAERQALALPASAPVLALSRERLIDGAPLIAEQVALPAALFPGLSLPLGVEMADELYVLYQRGFGIHVTRVDERIHAEGDALVVERVAFDLSERRVEHRVSRLDARRLRYRVTLA